MTLRKSKWVEREENQCMLCSLRSTRHISIVKSPFGGQWGKRSQRSWKEEARGIKGTVQILHIQQIRGKRVGASIVIPEPSVLFQERLLNLYSVLFHRPDVFQKS